MDVPENAPEESDVSSQDMERETPPAEPAVAAPGHRSELETPDVNADAGTLPTEQPHSPNTPPANIRLPPCFRTEVAPFFISYPPGYLTRIDMMPPSLLVNAMATHLQWLSTILYHQLRTAPLAPSAMDQDDLTRPMVANTPLWPTELDIGHDLRTILRALAPMYANLAFRPSYFR